ncbi:MAG TPA: NAD(P)-dependent alcohol dehydrogenase [Novosphingobium sp.]
MSAGATGWQAVAQPGRGIEGVRIRQVPVPAPGPGEALVRMRAASLNYRDLLALRGRLPGMEQRTDYVPLSCGCGEVVAVAPDVSRVVPGMRVAPIFALGWISGGFETLTDAHLGGPVDGTATEFAVFPAESLVAIPDAIDDLEAATLPCAGVTAWSALHLARPVRAGDLVVLQGTGGVSIAALQFARAAGAQVAITSSSDEKLARARGMGADICVNYRHQPDWAGAIRNVAGRGGDLLIDVVGEPGLEQAVVALEEDGVIAAVGLLGGVPSWQAQVARRVVPVITGNRETFEAMLRNIEAHRVRPAVDRVYPLNDLAGALRQLESGEFFGKIAINFP